MSYYYLQIITFIYELFLVNLKGKLFKEGHMPVFKSSITNEW